MAKRRFPNRTVWIMEVTFPIEVQKWIKVMPKPFTRIPKAFLLKIFQSSKVWSPKWVTVPPYARLEATGQEPVGVGHSKVGHPPWPKKAGQIQHWWRIRWWTYIAHRHDSLHVWGRGHWVMYHSYPYYNGTCWFTMAWPWRRPPKEFHPHQRG